MELSITTPAMLFPAISLLLLAFTNRFLALSSLTRQFSQDHEHEAIHAANSKFSETHKTHSLDARNGCVELFLLCIDHVVYLHGLYVYCQLGIWRKFSVVINIFGIVGPRDPHINGSAQCTFKPSTQRAQTNQQKHGQNR